MIKFILTPITPPLVHSHNTSFPLYPPPPSYIVKPPSSPLLQAVTTTTFGMGQPWLPAHGMPYWGKPQLPAKNKVIKLHKEVSSMPCLPAAALLAWLIGSMPWLPRHGASPAHACIRIMFKWLKSPPLLYITPPPKPFPYQFPPSHPPSSPLLQAATTTYLPLLLPPHHPHQLPHAITI